MRTSITIVLSLLLSVAGIAQDEARYEELIKTAFALYEQKDYKGSAETYSKAFEANGWKGYQGDRYNAACSWALAGVVDSAFFQLNRIAEKMNYTNLGHISKDSDLNSLHTDKRWGEVIGLIKANKDRAEANYDKPLVALLDSIHNEDQGLRQQIDEVEAKYGVDSNEMQELWRNMARTDSMNLIVVERILNERGWLGADVVGPTGSSTLFLVIQHADLATQEKYLPMMREAVTNGKANGSHLALLEDRVLMRNGKRQLYGSQIGRHTETGEHYVSPLEDPDHVDERRASVGLGPIADYISHWNMTWDVETYKKELPALEERIKTTRK
jgi:hypothetical protein